MATDKKLTKADILQGTNKVEQVYIEKLGGTIPLRPLTDGEFAQIDAMKTAGLKIKGKPQTEGKKQGKKSDLEAQEMEIDIEAMQKNDFEADCLAVSFAIADDEKWTVEEVKQMPAGSAKEIAKAVYQLSGATPEGASDVKSFRTNE